MKIESTIKDNFFQIYNESRGVLLNKSKILKNKNSKCLDYIPTILLTNILIMLIAVFLLYTRIFYVSIILTIISLGYILITFFRMYASYLFYKKRNFKNTIKITSSGLIDNSLAREIVISWDKIKRIVIKKYSLTVITNTKIYFFFDIKIEKKFLKAINPYIDGNLIIK